MASKPFILLTTSRRPTEYIRTFCKDLSHALPNIVRVNRGKLSLDEVAEKALELNAEKVVIVDRWKNGHGKMQFFRVSERGLEDVPPLIYLRKVRLRRDFRNVIPRGRRIKSVALDRFNKNLPEVKKLENALSNFFDIPSTSIKDASIAGYDALMQIQILKDEANCLQITFKLVPELIEIGPQLVISHLIWELS